MSTQGTSTSPALLCTSIALILRKLSEEVNAVKVELKAQKEQLNLCVELLQEMKQKFDLPKTGNGKGLPRSSSKTTSSTSALYQSQSPPSSQDSFEDLSFCSLHSLQTLKS